MKRNATLFGLSAVVGMAAAAGVVATAASSHAAPAGNTFSGVAYVGAIDSSGWTTGKYSVDGGLASGASSATATGSTATITSVVSNPAPAPVTVTSSCTSAGAQVITAKGAVRAAGSSMTAAAFFGKPNVIGTVTFGVKYGAYTAGAVVSLSGTDTIYLAGANCVAATTTPPPTSTTSTTSTTAPTSPTTSPTTSTSAPTSSQPTSTTTSPATSPAPTPSSTTPTEPPTPQPTVTTVLPVTG